ncbi:hypothetical protein B0H16DRAFT_1662690 [Mycena metata]|uniref:Uncharacterized protein n=1 Tax=Mycena metata TaxID=1033252 RepID=A0AAD7J446_9AGAR|nr:hypothetical protein B0H16DRAFT_1662690 [Mycena metata]
MTTTLEACFKTAESTAEANLEEREKELAEEESDISEQRVRLEAERSIEFYEELGTDKFATAAPSIMQGFLAHGDACTQLESEALQLAMTPPTLAEDEYSPMRPYNAMLDRLGSIQAEEDVDQPSARAQMIHARAANLHMAYELLEGAKENLAMSLHLESLEFEDD